MHYVRTGHGVSLVFVHGFACSHEDWLPQIQALKAGFEVVACDLRGHGQTPGRPNERTIGQFGRDVAALLVDLRLEKCIAIGHSMGCRVVLEAARIVPERIAGLVLLDGSRTNHGEPDKAEAAARAAVDRDGYAAFAEFLFRAMFFQPSALADAIVDRAVRQDAESGRELWASIARWDAEMMDAALAAVRVPVLAIQSTANDAALKRVMLRAGESSRYLELLKESLEDVRIEIVSGVGHFAQLEAAGTINHLIADFATPQ